MVPVIAHLQKNRRTHQPISMSTILRVYNTTYCLYRYFRIFHGGALRGCQIIHIADRGFSLERREQVRENLKRTQPQSSSQVLYSPRLVRQASLGDIHIRQDISTFELF